MTRISRRHFLQFAGSTLAAWGLSQLSMERYGKVLAQSTPRKLALLVGINSYAASPLEGCVIDVELQRHLLIHRFGFNPGDILTLTDEQATRQGILEAFEEHLIKQAKPGDVVAYHYSGHGSRVFDPNPIIPPRDGNPGLNGTFVPVDSTLPDGYPEAAGFVKDIMGHTLFLLMSALPTENVTVVLDSCFSGAATREFRVRAREGGRNALISPLEKEYQEQWLSRLDMTQEEFVAGYRRGVAKGVVLAATAPEQLAIETNLNGFKAGVFSYLLTHYLWQRDGIVENAIAFANQEIPEEFRQNPRYEVKVGSNYATQPVYLIDAPSPVANAVVTEVSGDQATLWLGGVELSTIDRGTVFGAIEGSGRVVLQSRDGLVGEAMVEGAVEPGMLLQVA